MAREEKALFALVVIGLGAATGCITGDASSSAEYEVVVDVRNGASDEPLASGVVVYQPISGPIYVPEPDLTEDAAPNRCRACGYNLTGTVSGVYPECGEAI